MPSAPPSLQLIPVERLSFSAYRLPIGEPGGIYSAPAAFLSLGQWFEAEKFRAFHPELFEQVLLAPTVREARRLAKSHQANWRGDWLGVRTRALACGLIYASRADRHTERWQGDPAEIAAELAPLELPERFVLSAAHEFVRLRESPLIAFFGAEGAPPETVGRRVNLVHKKAERAWTLAYWQGRHGSWRVHDWAVSQYIPIRYLGEDRGRLNPAAYAKLRDAKVQTVVFEKRKGKTMDSVIRGLRLAKIPVELDLYATDDNPALT